MRYPVLLVILFTLTASAWARQAMYGYCEDGGQAIVTNGIWSNGSVPLTGGTISTGTGAQASYPACQLRFTVTGGGAATVYDSAGNVLSQPVTAGVDGYWIVYADNGKYDVQMSGGGLVSPITRTGYLLCDGCGGGGGTVIAVSGTPPIVSSGGASPAISIPVATNVANGYLSSADWIAFNAKQAALGFTPENVANKNQNSGYAGLNSSGQVFPTELGTGPLDGSHFLTGAGTFVTIPAAGLQDPGGNGIVKRTALNTTTTAGASDITGLWTGAATSANFLRGDGSLQPVVTGSGITGTIPLLTSTNVIGNSDITDNAGVLLTIGVPLAVTGIFRLDSAIPGSPLAVSSAGLSAIGFGTAGDLQETINTATAVHILNTTDFKEVQLCGTTTTCSHTADSTPQIVRGVAPLSTGTATVSGISPAFTSFSSSTVASFNCTSNDITDATKTSRAAPASTSSITLTGTGSDVISYQCTGF